MKSIPIMDVTRVEFARELPTIFKHIADAHFIAFDLELSGIPDQKRNKSSGPKSLAERYKELKSAAETYHILQVGLTCVEEDRANAQYLIRSYNFNISPLIDDQLDLERDFTYSSGAVDFLLRHGYQMESAFTTGIPYLTRVEAEATMDMALARWDTRAIPDIKIRPEDTKALNFIKRVRKEIEIWQETRSPYKDSYEVLGQAETDSKHATGTIPLNRFERRLVHQVVRAEYPSLQTLSRHDGVQVKPIDKVEQDRIHNGLRRRLKSAISNQTGFRWVAEAMAGGDLSGLDLDIDASKFKSTQVFSDHMKALFVSLEARKKVLVGHNCLLDLVYFFKTFYGPLPDTVEQFEQDVHHVFPLVIDTKYLSTNPGSSDAIRFRNSQLFQIEQALETQTVPVLSEAQDHASYRNSERYHEAGFDSYVTAKVFLKLACKIASEHPQSWIRPPNPSATAQKEESSTSPANGKVKDYPKSVAKVATNRFFHPNSFRSLADQEIEDLDPVTLAVPSEPKSPAEMLETAQVSQPGNIEAHGSGNLIGLTQTLCVRENGDMPNLIPHWDTPFWIEFGNKIRVYGTIEGVCDLSNGLESIDDTDNANGTDDNLATTRPLLDSIKSVVGRLF